MAFLKQPCILQGSKRELTRAMRSVERASLPGRCGEPLLLPTRTRRVRLVTTSVFVRVGFVGTAGGPPREHATPLGTCIRGGPVSEVARCFRVTSYLPHSGTRVRARRSVSDDRRGPPSSFGRRGSDTRLIPAPAVFASNVAYECGLLPRGEPPTSVEGSGPPLVALKRTASGAQFAVLFLIP